VPVLRVPELVLERAVAVDERVRDSDQQLGDAHGSEDVDQQTQQASFERRDRR
jgi:hypothetical protein